MRAPSALVGRRAERARLQEALDRARAGRGSVVLLSGEAGVGKTRLATEVAETSGALVLAGGCSHAATPPYGPVVAALRSHLRTRPDALDRLGTLRSHLALLLPELGAPAEADRPTLFEAILGALAHLAGDQPVLAVFDDLQWSDEATLELLAALAEPVADLPVLVIGTYRSDGLRRDHGLRRVRNELRRSGRLQDIALDALELAETAELLAHVLTAEPSPSLARAVQDRTQGVPFFVEELGRALLVSRSLRAGRRGLELAGHGDVPLPDSVRDAVLITAAELSEDARAAAEAAAVAGERFDLDLVAALSSDRGLAELVDHGLVVEQESGTARFRHALTREALYADASWIRRRALHRQLAEALEARGARATEVATHWLGARDTTRARESLLRAAQESEAVHAFRDAAHAGRQALELWADGDDDDRRGAALERYARCSELAGELSEAARAWRELSAIHVGQGDQRGIGEAQRRLAAVHELRGDRGAAFAARRVAAEAFATSGSAADAALEHLAMANQLRLAARHGAAVELAQTAGEEAERAGRVDLRARALGIEGVACTKHGDYEDGLETVRRGLALALEHNLTAVAAELYQRLGVALYDSADFRRAEEALDTALGLCRTTGDEGVEVACVSCMAYVLRERGDWTAAAQISRELITSGSSVFVGEGLLGAIHCYEGRLSSARRLLSSANAVASRVNHFNMTVDTTGGLARVAAAEGAHDEARAHCRALLERWEDSDDHHYAVAGLRWAAGYLAGLGELSGASACAEALTRIASTTGHPDALAALAHAIAETALLEGDADTAAEQLLRAVELHRALDMPFERAQIELRAGVALAAAGEREPAVERLCEAYRTARTLGARPLAADAAREVSALGESVARRLGARAAADADHSGLSRRELEVLRLLAVGRTNLEIAQEFFLSRRTVDMHVRNILRKLDCRSRVEAAHRATERGLLT